MQQRGRKGKGRRGKGRFVRKHARSRHRSVHNGVEKQSTIQRAKLLDTTMRTRPKKYKAVVRDLNARVQLTLLWSLPMMQTPLMAVICVPTFKLPSAGDPGLILETYTGLQGDG
jgi:hypothetical protein